MASMEAFEAGAGAAVAKANYEEDNPRRFLDLGKIRHLNVGANKEEETRDFFYLFDLTKKEENFMK